MYNWTVLLGCKGVLPTAYKFTGREVCLLEQGSERIDPESRLFCVASLIKQARVLGRQLGFLFALKAHRNNLRRFDSLRKSLNGSCSGRTEYKKTP